MTTEKNGTVGIRNRTGEMNCFLNTAMQALWFMNDFRDSLLRHQCPLPELLSCLSCGMQNLFIEIKKAVKRGLSTVRITELRRRLASVHSHTGEFSIGCTADAMEVLVILLKSVHCAAVKDESQRESTSVLCEGCPSHLAVGLTVLETMRCECGAVSEFKWDFCSFVHPFYVSELSEQGEQFDSLQLLGVPEEELIEKIDCSKALSTEAKLPEFMRKQWENLTLGICIDDNCEIKRSKKTLKVEAPPRNYLVNLIWNHPTPGQLEILQLLATIPLTLNLDSVYSDTDRSLYCLKGIILYGFGHYLLFVRNQRVWYKVEDELYTKVKKGTWFSAVVDIVNHQFSPTGLIYTQTDQIESFDMNLTDWLKIEQYAVKREQEYLTLKKHSKKLEKGELRKSFAGSSPDKTETVSHRSSLSSEQQLEYTPNKIPLKPQTHWVCSACKASNELEHEMCLKCFEVKPGIKGWVCKTCTYLNMEASIACKGCRHYREEEKRVYLECKFCNFQNENKLCCKQCFNYNSAEIGWKCINCDSKNSAVMNQCWNCKAHKDSNLCRLCKSRQAYSGSEYCNLCTIKLCNKCKSRERQPGRSSCLSCCINLLEKRTFRCRKCGENGLKTQECPNCDRDTCVECRKPIQKSDLQVCRYCRATTIDWECNKCKQTTMKSERLCSICLPPTFDCPRCGRTKLSQGFCSSCEVKTESITIPTMKKSTKLKQIRCEMCKMKLPLHEHRTCCLCSKRRPDKNCNDCGVDRFCYFICSKCVKSNWVCIQCGSAQSKSKIQCKCGFTNTALKR